MKNKYLTIAAIVMMCVIGVEEINIPQEKTLPRELRAKEITNDTPIEISSCEQLDSIGDATLDPTNEFPLNGSYELTTNIDCSIYSGNGKVYTPIGDETQKFSGTFDGKEHQIQGLYMTVEKYQGVFGYTSDTSIISNVDVRDVSLYINADINNAGGLVASNNGTVSNSHVTGAVGGFNNVGGLIGINTGTIIDSHARVFVTGDSDVGGLIGSNDGVVTNSYATGYVGGTWSEVGGLIGYNNGTVTNSYATGNVTVTSDEVGVGGLIGYTSTQAIVKDTYATGDVRGFEDVGGLVGTSNSDITSSYATGEVIGVLDVGGLVGWSGTGVLYGNFATGNVTGETYVGGLAGVGRNSDEVSTSHGYTKQLVNGVPLNTILGESNVIGNNNTYTTAATYNDLTNTEWYTGILNWNLDSWIEIKSNDGGITYYYPHLKGIVGNEIPNQENNIIV